MMRSQGPSEAFRKTTAAAYESGEGFKKFSKESEISHSIGWKMVHKWRTFKTAANMHTFDSPSKFMKPIKVKELCVEEWGQTLLRPMPETARWLQEASH